MNRSLAAGVLFVGMLLLGLAAGWGLWFAPDSMTPVATPQPIPTAWSATGAFPGDLAPDLELPTLDDDKATLGEHRAGKSSAAGHRILLNFFASWCEPCRAEMPGLQAQAEKHAAHGWVVLGVDVMETRETASAFRDEFGLTFPILLDEWGRVTRLYQVTGTPTSLFINREGIIVERRLGYMSEADIAALIDGVP